jgi:N6-L-threonylcarbamoyladenine synthase
LLGLPYPGGPSISGAALGGDPHAVAFPRAMPGTYGFSFWCHRTMFADWWQEQTGQVRRLTDILTAAITDFCS